MSKSKVLVIGLDCASPELIFKKWISYLPNLRSLINNGISGKLRSCFPPITVPAWMCMFTGKDPGELGIYGFRNRINYNYDQLKIVSSQNINQKAIWDYCAEENKESVIIGVPPSFPPKKIKGTIVSCFMTPKNSGNYTFPSEALNEIKKVTGQNYIHDVYDFRKKDKTVLLREIYEMTESHFKLITNWVKNKNWDLFINIEIGVDRIHHSFWGFQDPLHFSYRKNNTYENAIRDYYIYIDKKIGEVLENISNDTNIFIVSDHGAKVMLGGFCINEWLINNGYLKLNCKLKSPAPLEPGMINWEETIAWAEGGYYGRLFFNMKDREPNGIVNPNNYEKIISELKTKLKSVRNQDSGFDIKIYKPEELYKSLNGIPPDLFLVFEDFSFRSIGMVGTGSYFSKENDTGADGANHDMEGMFILKSNKIPENLQGSKVDNVSIYDIFPTLLNLLEIKNEQELIGKSLTGKSA